MNSIQWIIRELLECLATIVGLLVLPFVMVWAHLKAGDPYAADTVWLIRVASPVLLPFASVMYLLVLSFVFRRRVPRFLVLLVVFFGTIAVEVLCLRAGIWI